MFSILIRPSADATGEALDGRIVRKHRPIRLRWHWRRGDDGHLEGRWEIPGASSS